MRPYLITDKLMRPSNMKRFPTPGIGLLFQATFYFPNDGDGVVGLLPEQPVRIETGLVDVRYRPASQRPHEHRLASYHTSYYLV
jgi:hypothetical protein